MLASFLFLEVLRIEPKASCVLSQQKSYSLNPRPTILPSTKGAQFFADGASVKGAERLIPNLRVPS